MLLTDSDLASIETPQDAIRLVQRLLPDLTPGDAGFFFRPAEQQLLTYALISTTQGEVRQVDRVYSVLVQDVRSLGDQFKGPRSFPCMIQRESSCESTERRSSWCVCVARPGCAPARFRTTSPEGTRELVSNISRVRPSACVALVTCWSSARPSPWHR